MLSQTLEELVLYLPYNNIDKFLENVLTLAKKIIKENTHNLSTDFFAICDAIVNEEVEKAQAAKEAEQYLLFDDEIVEIEELGEIELMDITVSRDNLFYANGILTKNSMGLPQAADFMLSLTRSEDLDAVGQLMMKQLKTRYNNKSSKLRFTIGIDLEKQQWKNVDEGRRVQLAQEDDKFRTSMKKFGDSDPKQSLKSKFSAIDSAPPF